MASKIRDAGSGDIDTDDLPIKEKRRVSSASAKDKADRRDRDRHRDHDRDRDRDRDRDHGRDHGRDKEHRNSMPSPSALSSLLSRSSHLHKKPSASAPRSSKIRTSGSDLIFPSTSSVSRSHRRKHDGELSGSRHRHSSSSLHKSASSRRRTKDLEDREDREDRDGREGRDDRDDREEGSTPEPRDKRCPTTGGTSSPLPDVDSPPRPRAASLSLSSSTVDLVPEMNRSRERLPYPSVNKAFSRESVLTREDLSAPSRMSAGSGTRRTRAGGDPLTPDATDLSGGAAAAAAASMKRSKSTMSGGNSRPNSRTAARGRVSPAYGSGPSSRKNSHSRSRNQSRHHDRPPSPPDTNVSSPKDAIGLRRGSSRSTRDPDDSDDNNSRDGDQSTVDRDQDEDPDRDRDRDSAVPTRQTSRVRVKKSDALATPGESVTTVHDLTKSPRSDNSTSLASSQATYTAGSRARDASSKKAAWASQRQLSRGAEASDAEFSPESVQESSSPKTPNPENSPNFFATADWKKPPPPPPPPQPHPNFKSHARRYPDGMSPTAAAAAVAAERLSTVPAPVVTPVSVQDSDVSPTTSQGEDEATTSVLSAVPPPPPPPPPLNILEVPRIDYLMQNGGLPNAIPKNFLAVLPRQMAARAVNTPLKGAEVLFAPFFGLLSQYQTVLANHGSVAVATGHRTVARRLLDRLENVFSRELPPDGCSCIVCESGDEPHRGLGWGEVLERVSGRIDLPPWPPLNIAALEQRLDAAAVAAAAVGGGTGAAADLPVRPASPVKIDPDIAEEFREHYLRQNKKVRASVDRWMRDCASAPASAPQEIDDETLAFAILTNLGQDDRPLFNALLSGSHVLVPAVRAPTPMRKPRQDFVIKTGLAIQRLYRLTTAPRDAETALYLVKNPGVHDLLHTIADIHRSEWEILVSGRFDGFLWSGADGNEDDLATPVAAEPSGFFPTLSVPPGSRGATPASGFGAPSGINPLSRNATPASFASGYSAAVSAASTNATRQAVSTDEEAEVAALAEVERQIYLGMEALEDAFEALHSRAEAVRTALRQRSAGLSMRLQQRRHGSGAGAGGIDLLPQSGGGGPSGADFERPSWAVSVPGTPAPGGVGAVGGGVGGIGMGGGFPVPMHPYEFAMDPHTSGMGGDSEWDASDDFFELKPEDSASNISSSQHRRPKRRTERRTPAPIEEEEE